MHNRLACSHFDMEAEMSIWELATAGRLSLNRNDAGTQEQYSLQSRTFIAID